MNDCPRRYAKKRLIGQFHGLRKNRFGRFCFGETRKMNDCHDAIPKRKRLIGQFHLMYVINRSGGFQIVECALFMPDAA